MAEQIKPKKVREILRDIHKENPSLIQYDNIALPLVWKEQGFNSFEEVMAAGGKASPAGTILRARNYILNEDRRG